MSGVPLGLKRHALLLHEPLDLFERKLLLLRSQVGHFDVRASLMMKRRRSSLRMSYGRDLHWRRGQGEDLGGDVAGGYLGVGVREDLRELSVLLDGSLVLSEGVHVHCAEYSKRRS